MKYFLILFFVLLLSHITCAQPLLPGGVSGAKIWEKSIVGIPGSNNGGTQAPLKSYDLSSISKYSIFSVNFQIDSIQEQAIFSIENDTSTESVITNKRLADLEAYHYANFYNGISSFPSIYSYSQNKSEDSITINKQLLLGQTPRKQKVPVESFNGFIPEFILFNRFLSLIERQKVETYLALKYGISLNQELPVHYLNSKGQIIWDAEINYGYNQHIAGIGTDKISGLFTKESESVQTPGLLTISTDIGLEENKFIIWGDNGGETRFNEGLDAPRILDRVWRWNTFKSSGSEVSIQTDALAYSDIDLLNQNEKLWIMIDRSGTGKYPFRKVDYLMSTTKDKAKKYFFERVIVDPDSSGADVFTFVAAPQFFTRSTIVPPKRCIAGFTGAIKTEIAGGMPPFTLKLEGLAQGVVSKIIWYNRNYIFENIEQGAYRLEIIDALNHSFTEKIWVSNNHSWQNTIKSYYEVKDGEILKLNAAIGMPSKNFNYQWQTPEGDLYTESSINVSTPGSYILTITDTSGCSSAQELLVSKASHSNIKKTVLFPNPSFSGNYNLRISLNNVANVTVTLTDSNGRVLKQSKLYNNRYYWHNGYIHQRGIYFIHISTGGESETHKLIVQ